MTDLFTNPDRFGDLDAWRDEALALHAQGPIHPIRQPGYQPFWAVIGYDEVSPDRTSAGEVHQRAARGAGERRSPRIRKAQGVDIRTLIHMDDPDHAQLPEADERLVQAREPAPAE